MKMGKALQKKIKKSNTQGKHFICRCGKKNWNTCLLWVLATHDDWVSGSDLSETQV